MEIAGQVALVTGGGGGIGAAVAAALGAAGASVGVNYPSAPEGAKMTSNPSSSSVA